MSTPEKFLLDADTLMTASRLFYANDLVPVFWEKFAAKSNSGTIYILDLVKDEIYRGNDWLVEWLGNEKTNFPICNHVDSDIISKYAMIMQYIQSCGYYNEKGLNSWARNDVADPWLIAAASVKGYTLITFEQSAGHLSNKNKSGKIKIPDIAKHFDVKVHNLYYMMRQLAIKIQ